MSSDFRALNFEIYRVALILFKLDPVPCVEADETAVEMQRDQLMAEIERIKLVVNADGLDKFKTGMTQLQSALNYIHRGDYTSALRYFETVDAYLKLAFSIANKFEDKIIIARCRILATLHTSKYFYRNEGDDLCSKEALVTVCQGIFDKLVQLPVVVKSVKQEFEGRNALSVFKRRMSNENPRQDRHAVLHEINLINIFFNTLFGIKARFSVFKNQVSVDISDSKTIEILTPYSHGPIHKLWMFKNRIFTVHLPTNSNSSSGANAEVETNSVRVWHAMEFDFVGALTGHTRQVECMAAHQERVFTGSKDNSIMVWDVTTLARVAVLSGHNNWVWCLSVTVGQLYSGSDDGTVRLWDLDTLSETRSIPFPNIKCMAVSGGKLYTGARNTISVYDLKTHAVEATYTSQFPNSSVSSMIVHEGRMYAAIDVTADRHIIQVYDLQPFFPAATLEGHSYFITSMYVFDYKLFTNSRDNTMIIYDLTSFEPVKDTKYLSGGYRDMVIADGRMFSVLVKGTNIIQVNLM